MAVGPNLFECRSSATQATAAGEGISRLLDASRPIVAGRNSYFSMAIGFRQCAFLSREPHQCALF